MSISTTDKTKIIEAIQQTDDERILFAITRLLQIDDSELTEWQKVELDKRNSRIDSGTEKLYEWNNVKDEIQNQG